MSSARRASLDERVFGEVVKPAATRPLVSLGLN
jgi:hypothetical protein